MSVTPGTLIAKKYRVERVIGEGGMGIVVAARHVDLGRRVAIKLVRKDAVDASSVERLLREARAAAGIESDHVARVLDVGRTKRGEPYLVLEHLEGQDLHARISRGPPPRVEDAVSWILQACEGLAAAHARGVVHRDLKPSNLFLARMSDGRELVKLLDFGLAKSVTGDDGRVTATGAILGSPSYMSPEHLSGRALDARSDVWSLGVTLYELLTRALPFHGRTTPEICAAVLSSTHAPIASFRHDVPRELAAVVDACLDKDPARRPRDVAELASRLEPFCEDGRDRAARVARTLTSAPVEPAQESSIARDAPTHLVSSIDTREAPRAKAPVIVAIAIAIGAALAIAFIVAPRKRTEPHLTVEAAPPSIETTQPAPTTAPEASSAAAQPMPTPKPTPRSPRPRPTPSRAPSASPLERF